MGRLRTRVYGYGCRSASPRRIGLRFRTIVHESRLSVRDGRAVDDYNSPRLLRLPLEPDGGLTAMYYLVRYLECERSVSGRHRWLIRGTFVWIGALNYLTSTDSVNAVVTQFNLLISKRIASRDRESSSGAEWSGFLCLLRIVTPVAPSHRHSRIPRLQHCSRD